MNNVHDDGQLQVMAGVNLIERSGLAKWDASNTSFASVWPDEFKEHWKQADPVFGRLMCWILLSAGAEFLAKGVCLLNQVEDFRRPKNVPAYPTNPIKKWVQDFSQGSIPPIQVTDFRTIGNLYQPNGPLEKLCRHCNASSSEREQLLAAYQLLGRTIRNRDAHAYVPGERDAHFWLVSDLFIPCFNLLVSWLVSWLPGGAVTLNEWRNIVKAQEFINSLP